MGRLIAIGGGTFEDTDGLTRRIVALSGKEKPNILFIGTALGDSTNPLTSCKKSFKRVCPGTIMKKLSIIRNSYTDEEIDQLFAWADVIYVGGGNTAFMLEKWRERGIDRRLKKAFLEDTAVLSGISAGAICWFTEGYTDSQAFEGKENWSYTRIFPGIDLFDGFFCPHYQDYGRKGFDDLVAQEGKPAIALEDCTAFIYQDGQVSFASSKEGAKAFIWEKQGDCWVKQEAPLS